MGVVQALAASLEVAPLGSFGMKPEHADGVVEKALQASSMKRESR